VIVTHRVKRRLYRAFLYGGASKYIYNVLSLNTWVNPGQPCSFDTCVALTNKYGRGIPENYQTCQWVDPNVDFNIDTFSYALQPTTDWGPFTTDLWGDSDERYLDVNQETGNPTIEEHTIYEIGYALVTDKPDTNPPPTPPLLWVRWQLYPWRNVNMSTVKYNYDSTQTKAEELGEINYNFRAVSVPFLFGTGRYKLIFPQVSPTLATPLDLGGGLAGANYLFYTVLLRHPDLGCPTP
jgi:hypothetical protein